MLYAFAQKTKRLLLQLATFTRRHPGAFALGIGILVLAWLIWDWQAERQIPSRGGLYFPRRLELKVPFYGQGDAPWKNDLIGPTEETIHAVGCAVASAAMVLASYGVDTDPGRLNAFLTANEGYTPQGWIYWEKAAEIDPGRYEKAYEDVPSYARIDWNLLRGNPVIVRVRLPNVNHFVVIAGKQGWDYLILDPWAGADKGLHPLRELSGRIDALRYYRKLPGEERPKVAPL